MINSSSSHHCHVWQQPQSLSKVITQKMQAEEPVSAHAILSNDTTRTALYHHFLKVAAAALFDNEIWCGFLQNYNCYMTSPWIALRSTTPKDQFLPSPATPKEPKCPLLKTLQNCFQQFKDNCSKESKSP